MKKAIQSIKKLSKIDAVEIKAVINLDLKAGNFKEQDYYDNIPENLQDSERAQTSDNCLDLLTTSIDTLIEVIEHLEDIQNQ